MIYTNPDKPGVPLSAVGLGGHEFLPDGRSRGFNEDFANAVKPGYKASGYGTATRRDLLRKALERGINFLDVTIDPEKEALGRNLKEIGTVDPVFIQTRPEGMGYGYDPGNRKMLDIAVLKAEVKRILALMGRERIDFLNFPILQSALDEDPDYLAKTRDIVETLKGEGLIRFATSDNFSGEATYLAQIEAGCFDALVVNFSFADDAARGQVLPRAAAAGMAVITRELFQKGQLFRMGAEAGLADTHLLARLALKWNLQVPEVTTSIIGSRDVSELENCLSVLDSPQLSPEEEGLLDRLRQTSVFREYAEPRRRKFLGG
ncbi:MAG: aldo/keto reductase [Opitutaceae bacterium]